MIRFFYFSCVESYVFEFFVHFRLMHSRIGMKWHCCILLHHIFPLSHARHLHTHTHIQMRAYPITPLQVTRTSWICDFVSVFLFFIYSSPYFYVSFPFLLLFFRPDNTAHPEHNLSVFWTQSRILHPSIDFRWNSYYFSHFFRMKLTK